jgi:hypothetical protein
VSKSRKKHPGGGVAIAYSDKSYKVREHRRERRSVASAIKRGDEPALAIYGNPNLSNKDGKSYWPTFANDSFTRTEVALASTNHASAATTFQSCQNLPMCAVSAAIRPL